MSLMRRAPPDTARCLRALGQELRRNRDETALVRGHVGLFGSGSASDELTRTASALAREKGVVFTQHQNTRVSEVLAQEAMIGGAHPLVHIAGLGALGPHCSFTHMNLIRDNEVPVVRDSGMSVIWCAAASMNWGFGGTGLRRRHADFHRAGVPVALGADAPKFGLDTPTLAAYLLSRDLGDAIPIGVEDIFEMATLRGARAVGMADQIGSLEPGKRADIVIRAMTDPSAQPGWSPLQNILLASRGRSVDTVLVDGRIVVRHGRSALLDEASVYDKARQRVARLAASVGLAPASVWAARS
jgi:5-methylthioadenosine/S-adenosylhomocysteine deaminase